MRSKTRLIPQERCKYLALRSLWGTHTDKSKHDSDRSCTLCTLKKSAVSTVYHMCSWICRIIKYMHQVLCGDYSRTYIDRKGKSNATWRRNHQNSLIQICISKIRGQSKYLQTLRRQFVEFTLLIWMHFAHCQVLSQNSSRKHTPVQIGNNATFKKCSSVKSVYELMSTFSEISSKCYKLEKVRAPDEPSITQPRECALIPDQCLHHHANAVNCVKVICTHVA